MTQRLVAAVGAVELRWIWERVQARLLRGEECGSVVRLQSPTVAERNAVARLLGQVPKGESISVSLAELEARLVEGGLARSLAEAATVLLGVDAVEERRRRLEQSEGWRGVREAAAHRVEQAGVEAAELVREVMDSGLLRRLSEGSAARATGLVDALLRLAERLPGAGIPLAQLAAEVTGDAHALDPGAPLGTLGLRLAGRLAGLGEPQDLEGSREAWARAGVLCDELSAPALALNLRSGADTGLGRLVRLHLEAAEPMRLSTRQLIRGVPDFTELEGHPVFICENPSILAAAANTLGPRCAPLVCTEGMPRTATRILLTALKAGGARLRFHADFDWAGLRIGNLLVTRHAAEPWRMSARDYLDAIRGPKLEDDPVDALWEPQLGEQLSTGGYAVHEEAVSASLLADLAGAGNKERR